MSSFERWNTHFDLTVKQTVFNLEFVLAQDPSSHNLGTTVWDASIVLAKYLEKNARKGDLSRVKVRGKRAVELGAGMGLAGMAFALLGADVILTDTTDPVMALLRRNAEQNMTPIALRLKDAAWALEVAGKVTVAELDWTRPEHFEALNPPFDYVLAADCVYSEIAVPHFLTAVLAMTGRRTSVVVCNEFRSKTVHDAFMTAFSELFAIRKVPLSRMDAEFQHPLIQIYLMKRKKVKEGEEGGVGEGDGCILLEEEEEVPVEEQLREGEVEKELLAESLQKESSEEASLDGLDDFDKGTNKEEEAKKFQTRRLGVQLAKTLGSLKLGGGEEPPPEPEQEKP